MRLAGVRRLQFGHVTESSTTPADLPASLPSARVETYVNVVPDLQTTYVCLVAGRE